MSSILQEHLAKRTQGNPLGIYSVCSAHPWVIRAAAEQAAADGSLLLLEATSNQVNQFGGYTGLRPAAFRSFVLEQLWTTHLDAKRLVLGGDHLGPNPWWQSMCRRDLQRFIWTPAWLVVATLNRFRMKSLRSERCGCVRPQNVPEALGMLRSM